MINLKTEIIYFKCTTDFEFEFNLNTALQMRLFTSCPNTDKSFLSALALAVSRSRAIIITSKFDEELITKLAGSIGFKTEIVSPDEFGITSMETDKIITGGVPLVTDDGVYGGIILESGPQSLIIITNERATRKKLMNSLVHNYLIDVANVVNSGMLSNNVVDDNDDKIANNVVEEIVKDKIDKVVNDVVTVDEVIDDAVVVDDFNDTAVVDDNDEDNNDDVIDNTIDGTIFEDNNDDINKDDQYFMLEDTQDINDNLVQPSKKRASDIFTIILAIILLILICFIIYSLVIEPFLNGISIKENLKHIFGFIFK